jgi:hypothetical protein
VVEQPAIELAEGENRLAIHRLERLPADSPGAGDVRLSIRVESHGFAAAGTAWIEARALDQFVRELGQLEQRRQGEAVLVGMSPDEFELKIYSVDRTGHMAMTGRLVRFVWESANQYRHLLEFGFEFCPSRLQQFVRDFHAFRED